MKKLLIIIFVFSGSLVIAQSEDVLAIKNIDSLIIRSRNLVTDGKFDDALVLNKNAQILAMDLSDPKSESSVKIIRNLGFILSSQGKFEEAEPHYLKAIAMQEEIFGRKSVEYLGFLLDQASFYGAWHKYEKAVVLYQQVQTYFEQHPKEAQHKLYADCLNGLALAHHNLGEYENAAILFPRALDLYKQIDAVDHNNYALCLNSYASLLIEMGNYEKAEVLLAEALAQFEKSKAKESKSHALILQNMGGLHRTKGDYQKALLCELEATTIIEKIYGKAHPLYGSCLSYLSITNHSLGNYEKSETLSLESLAIAESSTGAEDANFAGQLINLANLYSDMGLYEQSEKFCLRALDIFENKLHDVNHQFYITGLVVFTHLHFQMGNYEKALKHCHVALTKQEENSGKIHTGYSFILAIMSNIYSAQGKNEEAETCLLNAINILDSLLGKEHPDYLVEVLNLGTLYLEMGKLELAEVYIQQVFDNQNKVLGREHPHCVYTEAAMAALYAAKKQYVEAESLFQEAKKSWENIIGKEHPDYSSTFYNLALIYELTGQFVESESLFEELFQLERDRLTDANSFLSEIEMAKFTTTFLSNINQLGQYMLSRSTHQSEKVSGSLAGLIFDQSLFYKGFLMNSAYRQNHLADNSAETREISNRLKAYRRLLAAEYSMPIAERLGVEDLLEKTNSTEKELAHAIARYDKEMHQLNWQDLQSILKSDEVAIEFISFPVNFSGNSDSIMYAALLLKSGESSPRFVPLFEEKSLDSLLNVKLDRKADYVNGLYTILDRGLTIVEGRKKALYDILWNPIEKHLEGIHTIYFSPTGLLYRINIGAVPVSETEVLSDRHQFIEMNSTRQLVLPTNVQNSTSDFVLYGGIKYESDITLPVKDISITMRSNVEANVNQQNGWAYLPGTEREIESLNTIILNSGMSATVKKGNEATEKYFKSIGDNNSQSPKVLHISTHGYFFPDLKNVQPTTSQLNIKEPPFKWSEQAMFRSGLIMAGANAAWNGDNAPVGIDDGILTAYEISQMNLSNTELVVLSACETGLGDIQGNEGVYGLQRAFKIAGAKYIIMSLWQVPDKQTSMLMTTFYKKWLEEKMTIPDAFHAAQKELRDMGFDPYQWAGFVLVE